MAVRASDNGDNGDREDDRRSVDEASTKAVREERRARGRNECWVCMMARLEERQERPENGRM